MFNYNGACMTHLLPLTYVIGIMFFLSSCSIDNSHNDENRTSTPFHHAMDKLSFQLANEIKNNSIMPAKSPILVMTPVFVDKFASSNKFGRILQQTLMSELYRNGFYVSDLNISEYLRVTEQGDFILTRNWKEISKELDVNYLLVSTIGVTKKGYIINCRILYLYNHQMLAAANTFIPQNYLNEFLLKKTEIKTHDDLIYRDHENKSHL